jgi:circadian clock protein KaiB
MNPYAFKLYVTGQSMHSEAAIQNLRQICDVSLGGECDIQIIDMLQSPEQGEEDHILATPTLIKTRPAPARRIIGDLSQTSKVLLLLGLSEKK